MEQETVRDGEEIAREGSTRTWGMLCHLASLSQFTGVPFGHILGPLVVWLIKKDEMPYVDEQGKKVLNFQISMTIWTFIAALTMFIFIGFILVPALLIADIVLTIIGAIRANNREPWDYPLTIDFIK